MASPNLKSFDDLFKTSEEREQPKSKVTASLPLSALQPFSKHPFKKHNDEIMQELAESIAERGVIVPALVRPLKDT